MIAIDQDFLKAIRDTLDEYRSEVQWWKDEPRCGYQDRYLELVAMIERIDTTIARAPIAPAP